jgi:hypothetical protein
MARRTDYGNDPYVGIDGINRHPLGDPTIPQDPKPPSEPTPRPKYQPRIMYLVNLITLEKLPIQFVPIEMQWAPESNWVVIPSVGRNNPFYHYTGSEQTLSFQLDWNAKAENRQDVIEACRWVENLSLADGYDAEPPPVRLIFGTVFENYTFIVERAPFSISLFDVQNNYMPKQAYQDIVLKRTTGVNIRKPLYTIEPKSAYHLIPT